MNPDESLEELLGQNRFREAVIRLESGLLDGQLINADSLRIIPEDHWSGSPLLLALHGEACLDEGLLPQAKDALERAVKGLAALSLPSRLLAAMACLARIHTRMGELPSAETLLLFLYHEAAVSSCEDSMGEVSRALAAGRRLIEVGHEAKVWFLNAINWFEDNGDMETACRTMADLVIQCGKELEPEEWRPLEWSLNRWSSMRPQGAAPVYAGLLPALMHVRRERYDNAYTELLPLLPLHPSQGIPYYISAEAEAALLRAAARVNRETAVRQMERVRSIRQSYPLDLELQHSLLCALSEASSRLGLHQELEELGFEAGRVGRLLRLPGREAAAAKTVASAAPLRRLQPAEELPVWRVRLFGGLRFHRASTEVQGIRWKRRKAQELLLYLLLQPKFSCAKEHLMDILQLGEDPDKSTKALYVIVHQLKQTLNAELGIQDGVYIKEGLICLQEHAIEYVDVEHYMTLVRVADQLWMKERDISYEMYQEAYSLFDALLPELPYMSWLDNFREFILEKQVSVLRKCCQLAAERQELIQAEIYHRDWIRLSPYQEEAYSLLARLFLRAGRRYEAEALYSKWADLCGSELGLKPSREFRRILEGGEFI